VQKTNNSITGFSGNVLNIPEFTGPIPILHSQHHNSNEFLQQQRRNGQEERTGQEIPRTPQQPLEQFTTNNQQNASPHSTEDNFCWYREDHIQEGIQNCQESLIGKFMSEKIITKQIVQNTILGIWGDPKGFQISEVEGGFYHISMDTDKDISRDLKGNPWTIRNSWFMVQQWDRERDPKELDFQRVPIWIQLWGLPLHCKTIAMGKHIGAQLGTVDESTFYDFPDKARIIKTKVQIDVTQPIRPGIYIGNTKDGIKWVDFRYENLPLFCFQCGHIGHGENHCNSTEPAMEEGGINPRGPWLRATSYGRKFNDKRDPRFNSNPMKSMSGGCFSPIPKAMLDILAKMTLEEEASAAPNNHTEGSTTEQNKPNSGKNNSQGDTSGQVKQGCNNSQTQSTITMAGLISRAGQQQ
jgi:hypothetical protein